MSKVVENTGNSPSELKTRALSVKMSGLLPHFYVSAFLERYPKFKGRNNIKKRLQMVYTGQRADQEITEKLEDWRNEIWEQEIKTEQS